MQLAKFDHLLYSDEMKAKFVASGSNFGLRTYRMMLDALVLSANEVDVDLVLMLKDEVSHYCPHYSM